MNNRQKLQLKNNKLQKHQLLLTVRLPLRLKLLSSNLLRLLLNSQQMLLHRLMMLKLQLLPHKLRLKLPPEQVSDPMEILIQTP